MGGKQARERADNDLAAEQLSRGYNILELNMGHEPYQGNER
jgi:hypothetical protein